MKNECEKCGKELINSTITIINASCWKCSNPMKVAVVQGGLDRSGSTVGPDEFSERELAVVQNNGVIVKEHYSKTVDESYLANTCTYCNAFVGNFFLHRDYLFPASSGELECIELDGEPYCEYCSEEKFLKSINQI